MVRINKTCIKYRTLANYRFSPPISRNSPPAPLSCPAIEGELAGGLPLSNRVLQNRDVEGRVEKILQV